MASPAVLHTVAFLANDSVWGSAYTEWPAQTQMDKNNPALMHPSVLNANFTTVAQNWTMNGIAHALHGGPTPPLSSRAQRYVMVDIEQHGWDNMLYWATALGRLPNGSFVRDPRYVVKDAETSAAALLSMTNQFAQAIRGGAKAYEFGIYNAPGIGGTDVSACLAGHFSRNAMVERYANSSKWFSPALTQALSYLCPENYPAGSYAMPWKDMVAYNLTKYAYDYSAIVASAAVKAFPDDVAKIRPVVKSTFEVKSDDTAPVSWPFMDLKTEYTAQLCALRDAGITKVIIWYYGGDLRKAANEVPLDDDFRKRYLGLQGLSGEPVTEADLDEAPPRANLVTKIEARATDDLVVARSVFGGDVEAAAACEGIR